MGAVGFMAAGLGGVRPGVQLVCRWCLLGVLVASWWCLFVSVVSLGFLGVSWWCLGGFSVVHRWSLCCLGRVLVLSHWCPGGISLVSRSCLGGLSLISCWSLASLLLDSCWSLASLLLDSCRSTAGLSVVSCRRHVRDLLWCSSAFIDWCFCMLLLVTFFTGKRCEPVMFFSQEG